MMSPTTDDPRDPRLTHGSDDEPVPMAGVYLVLSDEELAKGFVRPLRTSYVHDLGEHACYEVTHMSAKLCETYARQPDFYGATYCVGCLRHRPVGANGEFHWLEPNGSVSESLVGT